MAPDTCTPGSLTCNNRNSAYPHRILSFLIGIHHMPVNVNTHAYKIPKRLTRVAMNDRGFFSDDSSPSSWLPSPSYDACRSGSSACEGVMLAWDLLVIAYQACFRVCICMEGEGSCWIIQVEMTCEEVRRTAETITLAGTDYCMAMLLTMASSTFRISRSSHFPPSAKKLRADRGIVGVCLG